MFNQYPLPWKTIVALNWTDVRDANNQLIFGVVAVGANQAIAEFIVAAVNACRNVPLEMLQTMTVEVPDSTEDYDTYPTDDLENYPTGHEFCPKCGESLYYCEECDHCSWKPETDHDPNN